MTKKKNVAKTSNEVAVPDYLVGYEGQGTENVRDLQVIPRIKLLQGLSPEVVEDGHRAGVFFHTVVEESLGESLEMVPVYVSQSVLLWRPRDDGGGILARATDGVHWDRPNTDFEVKLDVSGKKVVWNTGETVQRGGLTDFGTMDPGDPNSYPAATRMVNVIAMFPEQLDVSPAVISLQRSSFKIGQQLVSKLSMSRLPAWSRVFTMAAKPDRNPAGKPYFNFSFQAVVNAGKNGPEPKLVSEEDFPKYKEMYDHFVSEGFAMKDEQDDEPRTADTDHTDY